MRMTFMRMRLTRMATIRVAWSQTPVKALLALIICLAGAFIWAQQAAADRGWGAEPTFSWESGRHLSTTSTSGAFKPVLRAAADGTLMVAYNRKINSSTHNPYYRRSTDGGATWSPPAAIRNSSNDLRQVSIVFDSSNLAHAIWRTDSGLAHASETQWPNTSHTIVATADVVLDPGVAVGPDNVLHAVWAQGSNLHNIYHAYSSDGGSTWSEPVGLANTEEHSTFPSVVVDSNNNAHVVWEERIFDASQPDFFRYEVHYKKGTKTGPAYSWSGTTVASGNATNARRPAIAANGTTVHLSYAIQLSNEEQYPYYRRFTPESGWSTPRDISGGNAVSVNTNSPFYLLSSIRACGSGVYVYYHGAVATNAKEQIWGATSANNWNMLDVATDSDTRNINPSVVCIGDTLHLIFERIEQATVNHQIYYTQSSNLSEVFLPVIAR